MLSTWQCSVGRLPIVCPLMPLDISALIRILTEPKNALVRQFQHLFSIEGSRLEFTTDALEEIANRALKRQTGARALRAVLDEIMLDKLYELPEPQFEGYIFTVNADHIRNNTPLSELPSQTIQKESA